LFTCFRSHLSTELIPRMRKENSSIANFSMGKGRNTVGGTEGNLASNLVISLMTDKPVLNPSLKMKTLKVLSFTKNSHETSIFLQEPLTDPKAFSTSKQIGSSPERFVNDICLFEIFVITECLIYDIDVLICRISLVISPGSDTEMVHIRFCEGLSLVPQKHDEAKEVLVRAVVNNNKLLMLSHPMIEEKISFVLVLSSAPHSKAHWFSLRISSSSSGVKSFLILKVLRISSGVLPFIMSATVWQVKSSKDLMLR
ncbi:hypothetical protein BHE74_00007108, partial [Ensete ventricosum]